jgi:4-hydroxythreonine-4-phosphate dehydrogenase
VQLLVAADDRTGAFESAAVLADHGLGPIAVTTWPDTGSDPDVEVDVIDLGSRHLVPADAAARAGALPQARYHAHKIDSTLRGNWAEELAARAATSPVLLVPAFPALARTCDGGVVHDHGRPVHEGAAGSDVRRPVVTSRPAESLAAAGVRDVIGCSHRDGLEEWLASPVGVAVADAHTDDDVDAIVARWASGPAPVVLAGTSTVVGAAARVASAGTAAPGLPPVDGPILVVCGSVHPAARRQIHFAERRGVPVTGIGDDITARTLGSHGELIFATEIPVGDATAPMAVASASALARGVHDLSDRVELGALVIVGGDTAAAVLGSTPAVVHGSVGPGTAWVQSSELPMPIITRSSGYGADDALVGLLARLRRP